MLVGLALAALLASACGGGGQPAATPTPTPALAAVATPTPTPTPIPKAIAAPMATPPPPPGETGGFQGFQAFAAQIEQALAIEDEQFFIDRAKLTEISCTGQEVFGPCEGQPAGILSGIPGSAWYSDAFNLFSPQAYAQSLTIYFGAAPSGNSDSYGPGDLRLYALAEKSVPGFNDIFYAITTSMVDIYPTGVPIGSTEREAHAFKFEFENGQWQFTGELVAVSTATSPDWLDGLCIPLCYDTWVSWP